MKNIDNKFQQGDFVKTRNPNFLYRVRKVNRGWLHIVAAKHLMEGVPKHYVGTEVFKVRTGEVTKWLRND